MLGTHFSLLKYLQILSDILKQLSLPLVEDLAETIHSTWSQGGAVILYGEGLAATSAKLIGEYWAQNGLGPGCSETRPRTPIDVIPLAERQLHQEEDSVVPTKNSGVKQLERPVQPGDLLIFSVSDPSPQIQKVVDWANRMGVITWALTAHHGGGL